MELIVGIVKHIVTLANASVQKINALDAGFASSRFAACLLTPSRQRENTF
jgi:hypothetical protein